MTIRLREQAEQLAGDKMHMADFLADVYRFHIAVILRCRNTLQCAVTQNNDVGTNIRKTRRAAAVNISSQFGNLPIRIFILQPKYHAVVFDK